MRQPRLELGSVAWETTMITPTLLTLQEERGTDLMPYLATPTYKTHKRALKIGKKRAEP